MAITSNTSGSQTCTISTEHTLATITSAGGYQFVFDVSALADGATPDELEVRIYSKARSVDTERLRWFWTFRGAQGIPIQESPPVLTDCDFKVSIKQTQGTGRTIPWNVLVFA